MGNGVGKALATVTLGDLSQTFDGTARAASATTEPEVKTVLFTYTGAGGTSYGPSSSAPIGAGASNYLADARDPFGKGMTLKDEYVAMTDPNNPTSVFHMVTIQRGISLMMMTE
ncbi:MAG: hypothetical protein EOM20_05290 [Spartobacteria bacterium]|nr:hypothetical protein [Spartobacteria bacterium]